MLLTPVSGFKVVHERHRNQASHSPDDVRPRLGAQLQAFTFSHIVGFVLRMLVSAGHVPLCNKLDVSDAGTAVYNKVELVWAPRR
jgi:hypothetical protein